VLSNNKVSNSEGIFRQQWWVQHWTERVNISTLIWSIELSWSFGQPINIKTLGLGKRKKLSLTERRLVTPNRQFLS
jgi:hypothetical protein